MNIRKANKEHNCTNCNGAISKGDNYQNTKNYHVDYEDNKLYTFYEKVCNNCTSAFSKYEYKREQRKIRGDKRRINCKDAYFENVWQGGMCGSVADGGDVELVCFKCNLMCVLN